MACSLLVTACYVVGRNKPNLTHSETTISVRHQSGLTHIGNVRVRVGLLGILTKFMGRIGTQWSVSCSVVLPMTSIQKHSRWKKMLREMMLEDFDRERLWVNAKKR